MWSDWLSVKILYTIQSNLLRKLFIICDFYLLDQCSVNIQTVKINHPPGSKSDGGKVNFENKCISTFLLIFLFRKGRRREIFVYNSCQSEYVKLFFLRSISFLPWVNKSISVSVCLKWYSFIPKCRSECGSRATSVLLVHRKVMMVVTLKRRV